MARFLSRRRGRPPHPDILTPAEWRVLEHVRAELTNVEIATRLGVSPETVKTHVSNMLGKLQIRDRQALAAWQGQPAVAPALPRVGVFGLGIFTHGFLASKVGRLLAGSGATAGVVVGVAAVAGALGGGADIQIPPVDQLVAESLVAMDELDSYRSELVIDDGDVVTVFDWTASNRFRVVMESSLVPVGASAAGSAAVSTLEAVDDGVVRGDASAAEVDASGNVTETVVQLPALGTYESVVTEARIYGRACAAPGIDCGPWAFESRPQDFAFTPLTPSFEGAWVLVALEQARDLRISDEHASVHGVPAVALSGTVNHLRAVLEYALRRSVAVRGTEDFGQQCTSSASATVSDAGVEAVGAEASESCRPLSYEEYFGLQEPTLSYFDSHSARIEIWIGRQDRYVLRARLQIPEHILEGEVSASGSGAMVVTVDFSLFDEVVIEEPTDAIAEEFVGALQDVSGEFSGDVVIAADQIPLVGELPARVQQGKFYLVNLAAGEGVYEGAGAPDVVGPGGLLALSWKDPHLGCTTRWEADFEFEGATGWFRTPCHGETYTKAGVRVFGPAPRSLDTFPLRIQDDGSIVVDTSEPLPGDESNPTRAVAYPAR